MSEVTGIHPHLAVYDPDIDQMVARSVGIEAARSDAPAAPAL